MHASPPPAATNTTAATPVNVVSNAAHRARASRAATVDNVMDHGESVYAAGAVSAITPPRVSIISTSGKSPSRSAAAAGGGTAQNKQLQKQGSTPARGGGGRKPDHKKSASTSSAAVVNRRSPAPARAKAAAPTKSKGGWK